MILTNNMNQIQKRCTELHEEKTMEFVSIGYDYNEASRMATEYMNDESLVAYFAKLLFELGYGEE